MPRHGNRSASVLSSFCPSSSHLSAAGQLLLISTFIEDSLRILVQWPTQVGFMTLHRGFPAILSYIYLGSLVGVMIPASCVILFNHRRFQPAACWALILSIIAQVWGYGLIFNHGFVLKNASLVGGLFLLMAKHKALESNSKVVFGGLPTVFNSRSLAYLPFFGRILLILLFISMFLVDSSTHRFWVRLIALTGCALVVVGFKAKPSAVLLLGLLAVSNFLLNSWWSMPAYHPLRDHVKYDFFQTLSVMGGYLLLIQHGPGTYSLDEKKKEF